DRLRPDRGRADLVRGARLRAFPRVPARRPGRPGGRDDARGLQRGERSRRVRVSGRALAVPGDRGGDRAGPRRSALDAGGLHRGRGRGGPRRACTGSDHCGAPMLTTLVAFIIVLGVLVCVHELGHFGTAKLVDIEVPRFSIGLGPKLWGFRRGETEYVISWLPLGGYVKMAGMEELEAIEGGAAEPESETTGLTGATDLGLVQESEGRRPKSERTFESKSLPARMLVISAGVIMNVIFAFLVFAGSAWVLGVERPPEARVPAVPAEHLPPGAEALASVPPGSRVVAVGGRRVENSDDLQRA